MKGIVCRHCTNLWLFRDARDKQVSDAECSENPSKTLFKSDFNSFLKQCQLEECLEMITRNWNQTHFRFDSIQCNSNLKTSNYLFSILIMLIFVKIF